MVNVRAASAADLELIVPLFDAYRQFYRQEPNEALARRFLSERFKNHESTILLACPEGGGVVGFTQLFPSFSSTLAARSLILNDLFVAPAARRKGVGGLLLRAAVDFARSRGAIRLTLATEVTNHAAQALYEAEGWIRDSDFYGYQRFV